jgi:hypothetical protein
MAEIIDLGFGCKYEGQAPNEELVKVLEQYLELARKGDIQAIAVIGLSGTEDPFISAVTGPCRFGPMFGALKVLEIDLVDRFRLCSDMQALEPSA